MQTNKIIGALGEFFNGLLISNCIVIEGDSSFGIGDIIPKLVKGSDNRVILNYIGNNFEKYEKAKSKTPNLNYCELKGTFLKEENLPQIGPVTDFGARIGNIKNITCDYSKFLTDFYANRPNSKNEVFPKIYSECSKDQIDLVIIDGANFTAHEIVKQVNGAKAILVNGVKDSFGGASAFEDLFNNTSYELSLHDETQMGGVALFVQRNFEKSRLPIHFFTIILNGEPFIRYHEKMMADLKCDWHWHVIEGVADLVKDTAWSVAAGGKIPQDLHYRGKSNDGTTEYLDDLKSRFPDNVTIYRKPDDVFWNGKQEMVSAPIPYINEECILWQIDGDELWTSTQVETMRQMFLDNPQKTAAMFWCNYFVGPTKALSTRYGYAQNPNQEWARVWRFEPGMIWDKHEPPILAKIDEKTGQSIDVGKIDPFTHYDTEKADLIFDHFAYVTPEQARFKESYYGYKGAVNQWQKLQERGDKSGLLRDYFAWVHDNVMFDSTKNLGLNPLAFIDSNTGNWKFRYDDASNNRPPNEVSGNAKPFKLVVDGIFFQLANSGIARVWVDLLTEWVESGFIKHVVLLDRGGSAPRIEGVIYHSIKKHEWQKIDDDASYLQEVCDRLEADLFVSSYYTTPTTTPTVFTGYDMIPEVMGFDLDDVWWQQKRRAIQFAAGHTWISHSSANDMCKFHPYIDREKAMAIYISIAKAFRPIDKAATEDFKKQHNITRDFVMLVGERVGWKGYKNGTIVFAALGQMPKEERPLLVCVGGAPELEATGKLFLDNDDYKLLKLDDEGLRACYGAALAYICPSKLEGFGLPIGEAMSVGCPAMVCNNSSIPEVAGEAGIYFDSNNPSSFVEALELVRNPNTRAQYIAKGFEQVKKFDQAKTAREMATYYLQIDEELKTGKLAPTNNALADSFKRGQELKIAKEKAATLEAQLNQAKIENTQLSKGKIVANASAQTEASFSPSQMSDYIIALEHRLAMAINKVRDLESDKRQIERKLAQKAHVEKPINSTAQNNEQPIVEIDTTISKSNGDMDIVTLVEDAPKVEVAPKISREAKIANVIIDSNLVNLKPIITFSPRAIRPKGMAELPQVSNYHVKAGFKIGTLNKLQIRRAMRGLFDAKFYKNRYGIADLEGKALIAEFLNNGILENRTPTPFFDPEYYLSQYNDVLDMGYPAFYHFITIGAREGRNPNPYFDGQFYLAKYPDLKDLKAGPAIHFFRSGLKENRQPHPLFNAEYYLQRNPDVAAVGANAYDHFINFGKDEMREIHPLFDAKYYTKQYPEVEASGLIPYTHFILCGMAANYQPSPLFDPEFYYEKYPDVAQSNKSAFEHFLEFGISENRQPHALFDPKFYLSANPDVERAGISAVFHFLSCGMEEGRSPHPLFDVQYYTHANSDLASSGMGPFEHFLNIGLYQERAPNKLFAPSKYRRLFGNSLREDMPTFEQYLRYGIKL